MQIPSPAQQVGDDPESLICAHLLEMGLRKAIRIAVVVRIGAVQHTVRAVPNYFLLDDDASIVVLSEFNPVSPSVAFRKLDVDVDGNIWVAPGVERADLRYASACLHGPLETALDVCDIPKEPDCVKKV